MAFFGSDWIEEDDEELKLLKDDEVEEIDGPVWGTSLKEKQED